MVEAVEASAAASLNNESLEMMLHELGHTVADLADEYFAGASYAREYANMTAESDPEKVRWSRFIGKNGVGVYEYDNGGDGGIVRIKIVKCGSWENSMSTVKCARKNGGRHSARILM